MRNTNPPDTLDTNRTPVVADGVPPADAVLTLDSRRYQLLDQLGKGGMGEVYRCLDPALERDLAIKVMKAELHGIAESEHRFVREARLTGSLQHPGIVAVHNLGRLADGRLHYTMKLVRGQTFAEILNDERDQPERLPSLLEIFEKVCQAVAYAHSKRVIHRDLKPANVMVGKFGEAQVMDWGLAKLLSGDDRAAAPQEPSDAVGTVIRPERADTPSDLSRAGSGMGTPAYLSPEQAAGDWAVVDERTDVFSLGAILCEMLTGKPPYRGPDGDEVLRRARRGDLAEARGRLEDCGADEALKTLCLACLASEWEGRPRDAATVAKRVADYRAEVQERLRRAEVERAEAQIKAREERKRRHWALAFLALLLAAAALSTWQAVRATVAEGKALTERDDKEAALRQAEKAAEAERQANEWARGRLGQIEKANNVLASIFADLDPRAEEKGGPSLRQQLSLHLERAAAQLDEAAIDDPLTVARLRGTLGTSLLGLGQAQPAIELLSKAGTMLQAKLGADHPDTLQSHNGLAEAYRAAGRTVDAIRLHEQTLKRFESKLGADHPDTLQSRSNLATAYWAAGRTVEAIPLHEQILKQRESKFGADHPDTLESRNNLATAYWVAGRGADATHLFEQNLKLYETKLGADHPDTLTARHGLAAAYWSAGNNTDAIRLHEQNLKQRQAKLGADHPDTLHSRNGLAEAYRAAGRTAEAIRLHEQTLKQRETKLGADHPDTLTSRNNLAAVYLSIGHTIEAIPLFERTLKQMETKLGADHPDTLAARNNLAMAYRAAGQLDRSLPLFEQNLKQCEVKLGAGHPGTLRTMTNLGSTYRDVGRLKDAISLLEEAMERGRKLPGGFPAQFLWIPAALAETYDRAGQFAKAESLSRAFLEQARRQFGADDPRTAAQMVVLASTLLHRHKYADAKTLLRDCLKIREAKQPDDWATCNTRSLLGEALLGQKEYADAEPLLVKGYEGMKQRQDKIPAPYTKVRLTEALQRLVQLYEAMDKKDEAAKWRKKLEEVKLPEKDANRWKSGVRRAISAEPMPMPPNGGPGAIASPCALFHNDLASRTADLPLRREHP